MYALVQEHTQPSVHADGVILPPGIVIDPNSLPGELLAAYADKLGRSYSRQSYGVVESSFTTDEAISHWLGFHKVDGMYRVPETIAIAIGGGVLQDHDDAVPQKLSMLGVRFVREQDIRHTLPFAYRVADMAEALGAGSVAPSFLEGAQKIAVADLPNRARVAAEAISMAIEAKTAPYRYNPELWRRIANYSRLVQVACAELTRFAGFRKSVSPEEANRFVKLNPLASERPALTDPSSVVAAGLVTRALEAYGFRIGGKVCHIVNGGTELAKGELILRYITSIAPDDATVEILPASGRFLIPQAKVGINTKVLENEPVLLIAIVKKTLFEAFKGLEI